MSTYWKITLTYLGFGLLWIAVTDLVSFECAPYINTLAAIEVIKGWFYVFLSASLIYYLTKRAFLREEAAHQEKLAVYKATIDGVHHIFLNYLHQMQLVTLEAERLDDFDKEILELSRSISAEAATALKGLGEIDKVSIEKIKAAAFDHVRQ